MSARRSFGSFLLGLTSICLSDRASRGKHWPEADAPLERHVVERHESRLLAEELREVAVDDRWPCAPSPYIDSIAWNPDWPPWAEGDQGARDLELHFFVAVGSLLLLCLIDCPAVFSCLQWRQQDPTSTLDHVHIIRSVPRRIRDRHRRRWGVWEASRDAVFHRDNAPD